MVGPSPVFGAGVVFIRAACGVALMTDPVKVTKCPPAFAAPSTATLNPEQAAAIRAHSEAQEARYQAAAGNRRAPFTFGKRTRPALWRHPNTPTEPQADIMDDLHG